jgi:hypothetical protein
MMQYEWRRKFLSDPLCDNNIHFCDAKSSCVNSGLFQKQEGS